MTGVTTASPTAAVITSPGTLCGCPLARTCGGAVVQAAGQRGGGIDLQQRPPGQLAGRRPAGSRNPVLR